MTYKQIDSIPLTIATMYQERRKRARDMIIEIYNANIEFAEIEFDSSFTSVSRMVACLREEADNAARQIARDQKDKFSSQPLHGEVFEITSIRDDKIYITVKKRITKESTEGATK